MSSDRSYDDVWRYILAYLPEMSLLSSGRDVIARRRVCRHHSRIVVIVCSGSRGGDNSSSNS